MTTHPTPASLLRRLFARGAARWRAPLEVVPLAGWLVAQLAALAVGAIPLPLSRVDPRPPEQVAVQVMLTFQLVAACLLFPILFRSWRTVLLSALSAMPMLQLAALLAADAPAGFHLATVQLLATLGVLMLLHPWLSTQAARSRASAVLLGWIAMGWLIWMVRTDLHLSTDAVIASPLNALLAQLLTDQMLGGMYVSVGVAGILGAINLLHAALAPKPISRPA